MNHYFVADNIGIKIQYYHIFLKLPEYVSYIGV